MKRRFWAFAVVAGVVLTLTGAAFTCVTPMFFRQYKSVEIWKPLAKYEEALSGHLAAPTESSDRTAFAGMDSSLGGPLRAAREAYVGLRYPEARQAIAHALDQGLAGRELQEAHLLDAKLDMRLAEPDPDAFWEARPERKLTAERKALLESARTKFMECRKTIEDRSLRDEASGWLARVNMLLGRSSEAALFYLDELQRLDSIYPRQSLINSLHLIYPYDGEDNLLPEHVHEFLDTPAHALFAVCVLTNPGSRMDPAPRKREETVRKLIPVLLDRRELFSQGEDSAALALALMRASLFLGDVPSAVKFSRMVPDGTSNLELDWMTASCRALGGDPEGAIAPLESILASERASHQQRVAAGYGLMSVMDKLRRPVELLHAAFLQYAIERCSDAEMARHPERPDASGFSWHFEGWTMDSAYLLDMGLSDGDLLAYLEKYGGRGEQRFGIEDTAWIDRDVNYALAVRLARQERFLESAARYDLAGAKERADRMRQMAGLYSKIRNVNIPTRNELLARFHYADALSRHPDKVFFNDTVWFGYQTNVFLKSAPGYCCGDSPELEPGEAEILRARERKFQDMQEERWRAALLFTDIAVRAGTKGWLGKTAALRAIDCLQRISTDRFGRTQEIEDRVAALRAFREGNRDALKRYAKSGATAQSRARDKAASQVAYHFGR